MASSVHDHDREIALVTIKEWLKEKDAAYLAKENRIVYWMGYNPESKSGDWTQLTLRETARVIKATRAGFSAMKFVNPDLIMLAAQEEDRAYSQGISSRSKAPSEFFNFNKAASFTSFEMLTLCMLQAFVARGWNVEAIALGNMMVHIFEKKGWEIPNRHLRWKLVRAVADEAGMVIRDRSNRLTVYGVGRFVAVQIEELKDSIKTEFTQDEMDEVAQEAILKALS